MKMKLQCPYKRLANPTGMSMAWRDCQKDAGHEGNHIDHNGASKGWWAIDCVYIDTDSAITSGWMEQK